MFIRGFIFFCFCVIINLSLTIKSPLIVFKWEGIQLKLIYSLRFRLISTFLISTIIPIIIIMFVFLSYYKQQVQNESNLLINNTLKSISQNISTYLFELQNITTFLFYDKNVVSILENEIETGQNYTTQISGIDESLSLTSYLKLFKKYLLSIIIINEDGSIRYINRNQNTILVDNYSFADQDWYKQANLQEGFPVFIGNHQPEYFSFSTNTNTFSVIRVTRPPNINYKKIAIITDTDTAYFEDIFSNLKFSSPSLSLILDGEGKLLYSTHPVSKDILEQLNNNSEFVEEDKVTYNVFTESIVPYNCRVVVLVSDIELQQKLNWIFKFCISVALITMGLTFLIFIFMSKNIISSFEEMTAVMGQVKKGNLNSRCTTKGNDEMSVLKHSLNSTIIKLDEYITKEYRLILSQRNAEYLALQSQIQPHFLYNTLNGFIGLNRLGEREILENSILNLTGMMRYTLENEDTATVEQEFEFVNKYCELQKLRFDGRMNLKISYDEDIKSFKLPKLLLQPLVENCILYAVEPSDEPCNISITAHKIIQNNNCYIQIDIDDDGMGFDPNKINSKKGIGIYNVQKRLKLSYPNSLFIIESTYSHGTYVGITIPIEQDVRQA